MKVKDDIDENFRRHEPFIAVDYDKLINFPDIGESDGEDKICGFNIVNPNLFDFNFV